MNILTSITSKSFQNFFTYTEGGKEVEFSLRFLPTQRSWIMSVTCEDFTVDGLRICSSRNILDKFHNILDFGVRIVTYNGQDPFRVDDFSEKRAYFIFLDKEDLDDATEYLDGETQ